MSNTVVCCMEICQHMDFATWVMSGERVIAFTLINMVNRDECVEKATPYRVVFSHMCIDLFASLWI